MKKSLLVGLGIATLALGGAALGIQAGSFPAVETKADPAPTYWYLRGTMNSWTGSDEYKIVEGGAPLVIDLEVGDKFKIVNHISSWEGVTELTTATEDNCGGIAFVSKTDSYVNTAGKYAFSVVSGALYVNYGEFYYTGSDNSWDTDTSTTGNHPKVVVNGPAQVYRLTKWDNEKSTGDKFKLRNNSWEKTNFGYGDLKDGDFYGSFYGDGVNIATNISGDYDVSIALTGKTFTVRIVPHGVNPDDKKTVYVLDKYGNLLNTNHYIHVYNAAGQSTAWPGAVMGTLDGTTHVYKFEYWAGMETAIINDKSGNQTIDHTLASHDGECLILQPTASDYDGTGENEGKHYWAADNWVDPAVAKYIENYLHFQDFDESVVTKGTACKDDGLTKGYYTLAKEAYEDPEFASYRAQLCTLDYVVARLSAWAAANGKTFTVTAGVGAFSGANQASNLAMTAKDNNGAVWAVIGGSFGIVTLLGVTFVFRKRRQD